LGAAARDRGRFGLLTTARVLAGALRVRHARPPVVRFSTAPSYPRSAGQFDGGSAKT